MGQVVAVALVALMVLSGCGSSVEPPPNAAPDAPAQDLTDTELSSEPSVATASETPDVYLFAVGDVASCDTRADDKIAAFLKDRSAPIALLGDTVYDSGTEAEYRDCFDPIFGTMRDRIYPAVGNHEYRTADAQGYFDYFAERAGRPGRGWYMHDLNEHWRIIALNSNCSIVRCDRDSRQFRFLKNALSSAGSRNVLAYWHAPRYSSGEHGSNRNVKPFFRKLYRSGADIVLSGHDHDYERFAPQNANGERRLDGVAQFVVGTGGRYFYPFPGAPLKNSRARDDETHGVLRLSLRPTSYDWKFIPVVGSFTDSGSRRTQ